LAGALRNVLFQVLDSAMSRLRKPNPVELLHILIWAALAISVALVGYVGVSNYRVLEAQADERVERTLDVVQEHALRVLQTIDHTLSEADDILGDREDSSIRRAEGAIHRRLLDAKRDLSQLEAIWVFDREGRPLVSSAIHPVPREPDHSNRDYFRAHVQGHDGTFIGTIAQAGAGKVPFFFVSRARDNARGRFSGVIAAAVQPESLRVFYERLAGRDLAIGLIRLDGVFLARYPSRAGEVLRLFQGNRFMEAIAAAPEAGRFTTVSQVDGVDRRVSYRKLPGYPLYIQVGFANDAIWRDLRGILLAHLVFGLPATMLFATLGMLVLRRTRAMQVETQRRESAEAALKQAQRLEAVGQLTGGIAHDFNNLLMVVLGNVERLRRDAQDARQKRSLDGIEKAARRGADLTRQLLTFSRRQPVAPIAMDLGEVLPRLRDMLRSSLRGDIAIILDIPDGLWPARADPGEFELAILNLGVNARDAMPNGGKLTITARNSIGTVAPDGLAGEFVAISVRDTGIGIPPDILARVFEPFFTTKEVGGGTGLGLSQVYGFSKQAGGTATVTSEVGRGTEITLYLPRSIENPTVADEIAPPAVTETRSEARILLVEDNLEIAEVTSANLRQLGYQVVHAGDAGAALDVIESDRTIDLVFSDIVMPGAINGLDLARRLCRQRPGLPVVLTTGYSSALRDAAPDGFTLLTKPYDLQTLHRVIEDTLRNRGAKVMPLRLRRNEI
jgi:two-component system, NtrC family, sensor kinase